MIVRILLVEAAFSTFLRLENQDFPKSESGDPPLYDCNSHDINASRCFIGCSSYLDTGLQNKSLFVRIGRVLLVEAVVSTFPRSEN